MRSLSLSKSKSDVSGQSGHALPDCYQPFVPQADIASCQRVAVTTNCGARAK
jgi:hypothetical protein